MDHPPRTRLEQLVRSSKRTIDEHRSDFERTALQHGELKASLSYRQLSRWMAGDVLEARAASMRVAELHWGEPFEELVGPPRDPRRPRLESDLRDTRMVDWHETVELGIPELAQAIVMAARRADVDVGRRQLLLKLSSAFAVAAASSVFEGVGQEDDVRRPSAAQQPSRLNVATIRHVEGILLLCRHQGDKLGPAATLQTVLAQRELVANALPGTPPRFRQQAMSVYAESSQLAGWLLFNLGRCEDAQRYYDEARIVAHEAENVALVTYVLCAMSHLATWRGLPRVGIDHALAAQAWARQCGDRMAQAYAADVAARAHAHDDQAEQCGRALDAEYDLLTQAGETSTGSWWYFLDESFFWATNADCALRLRSPEDAQEAVGRSLGLIDPAHGHNYAFTLLLSGEAFIQQGEIEAATQALADASRRSRAHSTRLNQRIGELRRELEPWETTPAVRSLDEQLQELAVQR